VSRQRREGDNRYETRLEEEAGDPHLRARLRALMADADFNIDDVSVRMIPISEDTLPGFPTELHSAFSTMGFQRTEVRMRHRAPGTNEGYVEFTADDESLGTQRFFGIAGSIISALELGKVLAIDEIDDSLHPLLVRRLIELFHTSETNPHGAQLIVNTHDVTLLDTRLFRRDQIWFTEKDSNGSSRLYPLSDYSPRKGEALSKGYLFGRYGALPAIFDLGANLRPQRETAIIADGRRKSRQGDAEATQ
jgi:uncharacterized protein